MTFQMFMLIGVGIAALAAAYGTGSALASWCERNERWGKMPTLREFLIETAAGMVLAVCGLGAVIPAALLLGPSYAVPAALSAAVAFFGAIEWRIFSLRRAAAALSAQE